MKTYAAVEAVAEALLHEGKGQHLAQLTDEAIVDGSILIDPRNMPAGAVRILAREHYLEKLGDRHGGVQYYRLTHMLVGFRVIQESIAKLKAARIFA